MHQRPRRVFSAALPLRSSRQGAFPVLPRIGCASTDSRVPLAVPSVALPCLNRGKESSQRLPVPKSRQRHQVSIAGKRRARRHGEKGDDPHSDPIGRLAGETAVSRTHPGRPPRGRSRGPTEQKPNRSCAQQVSGSMELNHGACPGTYRRNRGLLTEFERYSLGLSPASRGDLCPEGALTTRSRRFCNPTQAQPARRSRFQCPTLERNSMNHRKGNSPKDRAGIACARARSVDGGRSRGRSPRDRERGHYVHPRGPEHPGRRLRDLGQRRRSSQRQRTGILSAAPTVATARRQRRPGGQSVEFTSPSTTQERSTTSAKSTSPKAWKARSTFSAAVARSFRSRVSAPVTSSSP